jgi:hypothetical protein
MDAEIYPGGTAAISIDREVTNDNFRFNPVTGFYEIVGKKQSYKPYSVYKAFVKMALSCLGENEIGEYQMAMDFITGKAFDEEGRIFAKCVIRYVFPDTYSFETPQMFIFRKRIPDSPAFTHTAMLYTLNLLYEFVIPFNIHDVSVPDREMVFFHCPPLFSKEVHFPTSAIRKEKVDFSSSDLVVGVEDIFRLPLGLGGQIIALVQDPLTGEIIEKEFPIDDVKRIHIAKVKRAD